MTPVSPAAREAGDALTLALIELADLDLRTPCQTDPEGFFADSATFLADAVEACTWCPVLELCGQFADANDERYGVWGGRLRSDRSSRPVVVEAVA
jgi:hypothetical protein